jgi:fatty-acyl-CoA synthase
VGDLQASYWPADGSLEVRDTTVGTVLRDAASQFGATEALVEGKPGRPEERRRWTFDRVLAEAEQVAGALLQRFNPGERVAVWAPNIPEWVLLELGAGLAGLVLVTVNPAYKPKELEYVLRQSGAVGIFLVPEFRGNPMAASLEEVRTGLDALREAVSFSEWNAFLATCPGSPHRPRPDPVHVGNHRIPEGGPAAPPGADQ